ncbi:uncharacterized protein LOC143886767 [Tasmannia lanceolata]|uniref:uncharacterized protein LOC143886767 n=1 Tax=Tasmannia lanceolata TaxID=3420 RepID=UPI004063E86F
MSTNPYELAKGKRLSFKGGTLATLKSIDKKKKKSKKSKKISDENVSEEIAGVSEENAGVSEENAGEENETVGGGGDDIYTIDAAKRMKYDQLFPVEAKKFGYDPKAKSKSVEDALDDRVKKKADRYCK